MAKRILLARGGALGQNTGLGGAHHNLRSSLAGAKIADASFVECLEYDLPRGANPVTRLRMRWFKHPKSVRKTVARMAKSGQCDVLHITDQEQAHLVPKKSSVPVVVTVHDLFHMFPKTLELAGERIQVGEANPPLYRKKDLAKLKAGLKRADLLICDSLATLGDCKKYFPNVNSICVPLGLDVEEFANFATDREVSGPASNLPEGTNLLIVGSHDPRKRLKFISQVLGGLDEQAKANIHIHHVGHQDCPYGGPNTHQLAREFSVTNWNGYGSNVSSEDLMWLRLKCDALLFPSASEGYGYPPIEAMACGMPVLCADLPSHNELMPEGSCLDAEDLSQWRDAIMEIHSSKRVLDESLIEHAKKFDNSQFCAKMSDAYASL